MAVPRTLYSVHVVCTSAQWCYGDISTMLEPNIWTDPWFVRVQKTPGAAAAGTMGTFLLGFWNPYFTHWESPICVIIASASARTGKLMTRPWSGFRIFNHSLRKVGSSVAVHAKIDHGRNCSPAAKSGFSRKSSRYVHNEWGRVNGVWIVMSGIVTEMTLGQLRETLSL